MAPPTKQDLEALAAAFLNAFATLDATAQMALRAPHCVHIFGPSSTGPPPQKNNAEYAAHITQMGSMLVGFTATAKETYINAGGLAGGKSQITIWANAQPEFRAEAMGPAPKKEDWEWVGEYIIMLDVDGEGKIERMLEFMDSKRHSELRPLVQRARENMRLVSKP